MDHFLRWNGWKLAAPVAEQEQTILAVAAGRMDRAAFTAWVAAHLQPYPAP